MISWFSVVMAAPAPLPPVYLETEVGIPRICVSMVPSAGPFKGKDAKTWKQIRTDLTEGRYDTARGLLSTLKKPHPAQQSVEIALGLVGDSVEGDLESLLASAPGDSCLLQMAVLTDIAKGDREAGMAHMEAAVKAAPDDPDIVALDVVLRPSDDVEATNERVQRVSSAHPEHAVMCLLAGRSAIDVGDLKGAADHFETALGLGVKDVEEPLFHIRRMAGEREAYLKQAASMEFPETVPPMVVPMDVVDFSKAKAGEESFSEAYDRSVGIGTGQELLATIATNQGSMECVLHHKRAPMTVASFVGLARGEQAHNVEDRTGKPFYDGLVFHRVIPGFMIQGGDPEGSGKGGPGYRYFDEVEPSLGFDGPGVLAMANSGPSTNGSQFFVTDGPTPHLSGRHTIFGQCSPESVEVVKKISAVETKSDAPIEPVVIESIQFSSRTAEEM